jgi:hypothetical protein
MQQHSIWVGHAPLREPLPVRSVHSAPECSTAALREPGAPSSVEFSIYAVNSESHRAQALGLVSRRYEQRGYLRLGEQVQSEPRLMTLCAASPSEGTLGTLGIRFDGYHGLKSDEIFPAEMAALRAQGRRLCEFTQLALEHGVPSLTVLVALFHIAQLYAHRMNEAELLVIEVNPRHVAFYRRMLGFKVCSEARQNPRVQAPAVLMSLELAHAQAEIDRYGGRPEMAAQTRSLYPHFFGASEQRRVLNKLRSCDGIERLVS